MGLWSFSFEATVGLGGGFSVSSDGNKVEITGKITAGYGAGASFDLNGKPSPHAYECESGKIARTTFAGGLGGRLGPLKVGLAGSHTSGNVVTTANGGEFSSGGPTLDLTNSSSFSAFAGATVGVEFGGFTSLF